MLYDKIQLEDDEKILVTTRRHWFVLFQSLFVFFFAAIAPLLLLYVARNFTDTSFFDFSEYQTHASFFYAGWIFLLWVGVFNEWTNYYLDVTTITNRRIIVINQKGFFRRVVASFRLERLQDMHVEINGFIATMLDYGELNVETAGHGGDEFRATGLPNPRQLKSIILKATYEVLANYHRDPSSTLGT